MLNALLVYLAVDAALSLATLGLGFYVFKKRGYHIRQALRSWLGVQDPVYHQCEVTRDDFDDEGLYKNQVQEYSYDDDAFDYEDNLDEKDDSSNYLKN